MAKSKKEDRVVVVSKGKKKAEIVRHFGNGGATTFHLLSKNGKWVDKFGKIYKI